MAPCTVKRKTSAITIQGCAGDFLQQNPDEHGAAAAFVWPTIMLRRREASADLHRWRIPKLEAEGIARHGKRRRRFRHRRAEV